MPGLTYRQANGLASNLTARLTCRSVLSRPVQETHGTCQSGPQVSASVSRSGRTSQGGNHGFRVSYAIGYNPRMDIRFYVDPETGRPHIERHGVDEEEVADVLSRPLEDRPGKEGARVAVGQTRAGRFLRVIYVPDATPGTVFVITAYRIGPKALRAVRRRRRKKA